MEQMKLCWDITKVCARSQKGQAMVEYGLILALIAVVAMVGVQLIGTKALGVFNTAAGKL